MKTKLIVGMLLAGSCLFAAPRISIGVGLGVPAPVYGYGYYRPAPVYVAPAPVYAAPAYVAPAPSYYVPPAPGPGYSWVAGYWYGVGVNRAWRPGYWAEPRGHFAVRGRYYRR
jgi:hypothetical protein